MTVRVVSEKPRRAQRVECPTCYALEFTGEDVTTTVDGDGDRYQTITCPRPTCKQGPISVRWPGE